MTAMRIGYSSGILGLRVWLLALVSSVMPVTSATAHEVRPAITDFTVSDGAVSITLDANIEAFIAGIDLDGLGDTNNSPFADEYDRLRVLPAAALRADFTTFWEQMSQDLVLSTDAGPLVATLAGVTVDDIADVALPRDSVLVITAPLPTGATTLTLGWPARYGAMVVRQNGVEAPYTGYLTAGETSAPIDISGGQALGALATFGAYIPIGFDHILPKGLDHILFVLGLFFLSTQMRPLLFQITAFTAAHTVTLALGALDIVTIPGRIVEPLIAASIVYVAVENILLNKLSPWRPAVVFGFGLLHGLGFASVLEEFGIPDAQFVPALIGFNVGVELGQLTVVALAFLVVGYWFGNKPWYRRAIAIPASVFIAVVGAYWFVERVFL